MQFLLLEGDLLISPASENTVRRSKMNPQGFILESKRNGRLYAVHYSRMCNLHGCQSRKIDCEQVEDDNSFLDILDATVVTGRWWVEQIIFRDRQPTIHQLEDHRNIAG